VKPLIVILFVLLADFSTAQTKTFPTYCNCADNMDYTITQIKNNYVGYQDKTQGRRREFNEFTKRLSNKANKENNTSKCLYLINLWLSFFDDKHIRIDITHNSDDAVRSIFSTSDTVRFEIKDFKLALQKQKFFDKIEGIWQNPSGSMEMGITRLDKKNEFVGFILRYDSVYWMPKQVRMTVKKQKTKYQTFWYNGDHASFSNLVATVDQNSIQLGGIGKLYKVYPTDTAKHHSVIRKDNQKTIDFRLLDNETGILVLKSFQIKHKKTIDSLLISNEHILKSLKNLIIDLRNNTGGLNPSFEKVIPYLYTNPITIDGSSILATSTNIKYYNLQSIENSKYMDEDRRKRRENLISLMKQYEGTFTPLSKDSVIHYDTILPYPSKVAIIINEYTASSAEFFLLRARQSTKVKVFGQPTMGAVDYVDMLTLDDAPNKLFHLSYPMTKTSRLIKNPHTSSKLQPDILLSNDLTDWVLYIKEYLNKNW